MATKARGTTMTDIIERLRIESRREPHEPIWRDAIDEIEALRAEVERLSRYYKNGIDCFANPCERHSGERTPPFAEFFEKYGGQCLICVVDNNKALQADNERLAEALELMVTTHDEGGWPTATIAIARAALTAYRKQGGEQ